MPWLLVAIGALSVNACTSGGQTQPAAGASPAGAVPAASPRVTAPGAADSALPDPLHVRATSAEEVLDALSDAGFDCDWKKAPDDPGSDESVDSCKEQNAYLWFSPTLPASGFVDAARGEATMKGFMYMTGDHWVMVSDRATIVSMSRAIGGDAGVF